MTAALEGRDRDTLRLARLYGIQTTYTDMWGHRRRPPARALHAMLEAMGAHVHGRRDVGSALRECRRDRLNRWMDYVLVVRPGGVERLALNLPSRLADATAELHLTDEGGETVRARIDLSDLTIGGACTWGKDRWVSKSVPLRWRVPPGYYQLRLTIGSLSRASLVLAAPPRCYEPVEGRERGWGVFLPLYALRKESDWGIGDFEGLDRLCTWAVARGAGSVATLPLLASNLGEHEDHSPYAPVSRLFWNEIYIDPGQVPACRGEPSVRDYVNSRAIRGEREKLRGGNLVDYQAVARLKRRVLERAADTFFATTGGLFEGFAHYVRHHPRLEEYARFRAVRERLGRPWQTWPARLRRGSLDTVDYDEPNRRYHLFTQWLAESHLERIARRQRENGCGLFLDLPLGVSADGYDTWSDPGVFIAGLSAGAPPDTFFTHGQNWGFPPPHPVEARRQEYRYLRACLAHSMRHASMLRVDHVMSFHRLFCIPEGMGARDGLYLRYPARELYAILCLESHRHRTRVVGEDLGTVPGYVREMMKRKGVLRMFVTQFEVRSDSARPLPSAPADSVACVNTHDMPTFAAFCRGSDVMSRVRLNQLPPGRAVEEMKRRERLLDNLARGLGIGGYRSPDSPGAEELLRSVIRHLGRSRADTVLLNLEDLWGEEEPQNVPGTGLDVPNWRRKADIHLEDFSSVPGVVELTTLLDQTRRKKKPDA